MISPNALRPMLDDLLADQRDAFLQVGPPTLAARQADLKKLRSAVIMHREQIERALEADFGHRSRHETAMMELVPVVQGIDYLLRHLRRLMRPERRHVEITFRFASARVEYQPLGVIGIVSPWNYPFGLALMPLATALAAGNRVMIKPSELTPRASALMATMLGEIFPREQVAVVTGDAKVGAAFTALPFDHLLFTGSTRVGKIVMHAAAENLVPVTLELGGKSPVIVAPGYVSDETASGIAFGKFANAGQTCVAPDYALVHADEVERFRAAFDRAVLAFYPQGPSSPDYTSIINEHHFARLTDLIEDAAVKGALVVALGRQVGERESRIRTLPPTLILDPTEDMKIMREEIFGPVLPVVTYQNLDEAIAYVNRRPRPLALYYFGGDDADRQKVLSRTTSGNLGINNTLMHYAQDDLPFGGVGQSGMGAYHGTEGFRSMSHAKGVYVQGRWNTANLLRAPFGRLADRVLRYILH